MAANTEVPRPGREAVGKKEPRPTLPTASIRLGRREHVVFLAIGDNGCGMLQDASSSRLGALPLAAQM